MAEYEAARILSLTMTPSRQDGYDAVEKKGDVELQIQIFGRCLQDGTKQGRLESIRLTLQRNWRRKLAGTPDLYLVIVHERANLRTSERPDKKKPAVGWSVGPIQTLGASDGLGMHLKPRQVPEM